MELTANASPERAQALCDVADFIRRTLISAHPHNETEVQVDAVLERLAAHLEKVGTQRTDWQDMELTRDQADIYLQAHRATTAQIAGYIRHNSLIPEPNGEVEEHVNDVLLRLADEIENLGNPTGADQ